MPHRLTQKLIYTFTLASLSLLLALASSCFAAALPSSFNQSLSQPATAERLIETRDASNANNGAGNIIAVYAHDPFGRRIKKTINQNNSTQPGASTGTTVYFYADEGLIAETDASGTLTTTYGWQPDGIWGTDPVFKRDYQGAGANISITEHYYHNDSLGTPQALTNAQGELTWRGISEAYGLTLIDTSLTPQTTGITTNNLRLPGQYEDTETGTYYNYFRDYDPVTGRYLQRDPIGMAGGFNPYAYVNGNPLRFADPYGLWAWGDPLDQRIVDAAAGFGDGLTAGFTATIRKSWNIGGVDECSLAYRLSEGVGAEYGGIIIGAGVVKVASVGIRVGRAGFARAAAYLGERQAAKGATSSIETAVHGAERKAGAATRGGVLSVDGVAAVRESGRVLTQADGATGRVLETSAGRFDVVVEGERGIITTFEKLKQKSFDRLAKNYGWK